MALLNKINVELFCKHRGRNLTGKNIFGKRNIYIPQKIADRVVTRIGQSSFSAE